MTKYIRRSVSGTNGHVTTTAFLHDFLQQTNPTCWSRTSSDSTSYTKMKSTQEKSVEEQITDLSSSKTKFWLGFSWSDNIILDLYFYYTSNAYEITPNIMFVTMDGDNASFTQSTTSITTSNTASMQYYVTYEFLINDEMLFFYYDGDWQSVTTRYYSGIFTTLDAPYIIKKGGFRQSTFTFLNLAEFWGKEGATWQDYKMYLVGTDLAEVNPYDRMSYLYDTSRQNYIQYFLNKKLIKTSTNQAVRTLTSVVDCTQVPENTVIELSTGEKYYTLDTHTMINITEE